MDLDGSRCETVNVPVSEPDTRPWSCVSVDFLSKQDFLSKHSSAVKWPVKSLSNGVLSEISPTAYFHQRGFMLLFSVGLVRCKSPLEQMKSHFRITGRERRAGAEFCARAGGRAGGEGLGEACLFILPLELHHPPNLTPAQAPKITHILLQPSVCLYCSLN